MKMINRRERILIQECLIEFGVDVERLEGIMVCIGKKVFLVKENILEIVREIEMKTGRTPYAVGVEIGTLLREFEPSLELAELICEYTEEKAVVNEEGEKLFSYGRDVFLENVRNGKTRGKKIVVNERGEVLGFGFFDGAMLKNVVDKGFYLRGKKGRR